MTEYSDAITATFAQPQQVAASQTVSTIDDDPDNAARALELERVTGVPAPIIHGNLEDFDRQNRVRMASDIVGQNSYLSNYVASNPMASRVSNDDYGQLDATSQAIQKLGSFPILKAAMQGFKEGWGGPVGEWALRDQKDFEFAQKYPGTTALAMTAGGVLEVPMKLMSAWTQAATQGAGAWATQMGMSSRGQELGKQFGEFVMDPGVWASINPVLGSLMHPQGQKAINDAAKSTSIYIDANKDVPVGHSPITDMVKVEQADLDLQNLKEALRESVASTTRERAPELFRQFLRDHTDAKIGISPEAIERLYGDKVPTVTDGKLGWVPRLGEQVELARAAGTDVEVPLADFLAKADPKILQEIEDGVRVRADGLTKEEAEAIGAEAKEGVEQGVDLDRQTTPVDTVRANAALRPFIDAFHGTPHEFSAFDISKIGAGEGAQSYGHGLYFAENREVASSYQERLGGRTIEGKPFDKNDPYHTLVEYLSDQPEEYKQTLLKTISQDIEDMESTNRPGDKQQLVKFKKMKEILEKGEKLPEPDAGRLLRVRINADREHFLDYDKGLTEQSPHVKGAIDKMDPKFREALEDYLEAHDQPELMELNGGELLKLLERWASEDEIPGVKSNPDNPHFRAEASEFIHNLGIPGIKYLDQGSRDAKDIARTQKDIKDLEQTIASAKEKIERIKSGKSPIGREALPDYEDLIRSSERDIEALKSGMVQPTSNFVLFDGKLAEITHVNDVPTEAEAARQAEAQKKPRYRKPKQLELDLKQLDERDAFEKASAIGMTVDQYKRYLRLIEKQRMADYEAEVRRKAKDEARTQTEEWRQNEVAVRKDVIERLNQRPDIIADKFFRESQLYGEALEDKPKLSREHLTPEQQEALPKSFQAAKGMHPDDAAGLLGYSTGDALVGDLAKLHADRMSAGGRPDEFFRKMVNAETAVEMEKKYGNLKANILREAQELALSATQVEMLHEETLAAASLAKAQFELKGEEIKAWIKDRFDRTSYGDVSLDKYLSAAGKAGRANEVALLKGDFAEAFRQKQRQYFAVRLAAEAKDFVREQEKFERTLKRFQAREVTNVGQEYTDQIHDLMIRLGQPVKRSVQDLQDSQKRSGYSGVEDFAQKKTEATFGMLNIPVPEYLADPAWHRPLDEMSVADFREIKDTIDVLAKLGRDQNRVITAADAMEKNLLIGAMTDQLSSFSLKDYKAEPKGKFNASLRSFIASGTANETLMNRWDRSDPNGLFNRFIVYPFARASNLKADLVRQFSRLYGDIGKVKDAEKLVESPLIDPLSITKDNPEGYPVQGLKRKHVANMVSHAGNEVNWDKFARGWGADPTSLMRWLVRNSDLEMWQRADKLGNNVFKKVFELAQDVYRRVEGVAPEKIELKPFEVTLGDGTKFRSEGWYHPLIKDASREAYFDAEGNRIAGLSKDQAGGAIYDKTDNFHARTANGYTKARTNVVYPIDLNPDMVPVRLMQMIHDIAFREPIINTEKIFGDQRFRNEVKKFYGEEYADGLMPYLRGLAGQEGIPSRAYALAQNASEFLRQNTIFTYIGFNIYTALKHGPTAMVMSMRQAGIAPFAKAASQMTFQAALRTVMKVTGESEYLQAVHDLYSRGEDITLSNQEFVDKNSGEVRRRQQHWQDIFAGQHATITDQSTFRARMMEAGSWLVRQSDMASVRPTWLASYRNAIAEGVSHDMAVDRADAAVRKAHGSTAQTNQPALVSGGGPLHGWLTSIYGFFGTVMQRQIELGHAINDAYQLKQEAGLKEAAKKLPDIGAQILTYVIWPALVEEYVTGLTSEDRKGWGRHAVETLIKGVSSPVLYLRDIAHGILTGKDPGVGLITSAAHDTGNLVRDLGKGKKMFSKEQAGKTVGDIITNFGIYTGRTPKELGNLARFGIDIANRQQNPRTLGDWFRGATRGNMKKFEVK